MSDLKELASYMILGIMLYVLATSVLHTFWPPPRENEQPSDRQLFVACAEMYNRDVQTLSRELTTCRIRVNTCETQTKPAVCGDDNNGKQ